MLGPAALAIDLAYMVVITDGLQGLDHRVGDDVGEADLLPWRRRRCPLRTLRLTSSSRAGTVRTEVAVGTSWLASIASTIRAAAPRSGTSSGAALPSPSGAALGFGFSSALAGAGCGLAAGCSALAGSWLAAPLPGSAGPHLLGRLAASASTWPSVVSSAASRRPRPRTSLGEEVPARRAHRLGVVEVLPVDLVDQPDVGAELRTFEPAHYAPPRPEILVASSLPLMRSRSARAPAGP